VNKDFQKSNKNFFNKL